MRGDEAPAIERQRPAAVRSVDPVHPCVQPQPHSRGVFLQVGHVVIAGRVRAAAARDARTRLMRERPVGVQPEVVMAAALLMPQHKTATSRSAPARWLVSKYGFMIPPGGGGAPPESTDGQNGYRTVRVNADADGGARG